MCGIVGAMAFEGSRFRITEPYIVRLRDTLSHRGPDGDGLWLAKDRSVGLGHKRLSIIDLSAAASQPMCNEDGTLWLTYNGEIYNHREIRTELERTGRHRWKTDHSDTEVILHAYEEWGLECLQRFRGMFAFALWDARARQLWLVRDRIGIKPLYYSVHHGRITFASEIKALLQDPEQPREVHEEAFYHYLSFLTTPPPQTLFNGIKKLAGGTWLRVGMDGRITERRYWDPLDDVSPLVGVDEEEIALRIMDELRNAVRLRKVADVPVGVFLSGGVDSSTNAALFSEGESDPIRSYSIGYRGEYASYPSELPFARLMAETVGSKHHEKLLDEADFIDFLPKMVRHQDEPIADAVCVPVYYLSKLARDTGVKVCQLGEGADELFCGYPHWLHSLDMQRASDFVPIAWPKKAAANLMGILPRARYSQRLEWLRRAGSGQPIFWGGTEAFTEIEKKKLLHPRLRRHLANLSSHEAIGPIRKRFEERCWEKSPLHWMSYLDLNLRLPELLLMRVDKMSMAASLEARVPFLDHVFVNLAMGIPAEMKTRNRVLKYILKKAVRDVVPEEIITRKKQGFGVPLAEWLLGELGSRARSVLREFCLQTDFLEESAVMRCIEEGRANQTWYLLNFALWWNQYIADEPVAAGAGVSLKWSS